MPSFVSPFAWPLGGSGVIPTPTPTITPGTPANSGTTNVTSAIAIRSFLPPIYRNHTAWEALIAALANGDDDKKQNLESAYRQLWLSSASEQFLTARASAIGISRPEQIAISDENFRSLAISTNSHKLTVDSILEALEILFGVDALRAYSETANFEPFVLADSQQLLIEVDGQAYCITFRGGDFGNPDSAKAQEVAEAINRQLRLQQAHAFALPHVDPSSQRAYVRLYSGARGLKGSVKVVGGQAQNGLKFPTDLGINSNGTIWNITKSAATLRFTATVDPGLSGLRIGDYVSIFGTEFAAGNRGSYIVTSVVLAQAGSYFEVTNQQGVAQSVTQATSGAVTYYRPTRLTVNNNARIATVLQPANSTITVKMPATTQVVNRQVGQAAYMVAPTILTISSGSRDLHGIVTITTIPNHGLSVGDWIDVSGLMCNPTLGATIGSGGLNGMYQVASVVDSGTLTYVTPDFTSMVTQVYSGGTVMPFKAVKQTTADGPYCFDPHGGYAITGVSTTTTMPIAGSGQYGILTVTDASGFPDAPGYIMVAFGRDEQAAPIKYLARPSSTQLLIDYSFVFPKSIATGATVTMLAQKGPFAPDGGDAGAFYVTASNAGLAYAKSVIDIITAAGLDLTQDITYPGDYGLGGEGWGTTGQKLSDKVGVWGPDDLDAALDDARSR